MEDLKHRQEPQMAERSDKSVTTINGNLSDVYLSKVIISPLSKVPKVPVYASDSSSLRTKNTVILKAS